MNPRTDRAALFAVLVLAAVLRASGIGAGLRHAPHWDEQVFVENVRTMIEERSLDHRFYEYPGLLFYILLPVLALLPREMLAGPEAYLAARCVIAAFGVMSVGLVHRLGSALAGPGVGLAAAFFLAVSPLDVATAHSVRPDVVLQALVLVALLCFRRLDGSPHGDVRAGIAIGAATAVKFTGLLLIPSYLAASWPIPGPRGKRLILAGLIGLGVVLLATPYSLIHARTYLHGIAVQLNAHYAVKQAGFPYHDKIWFYAKAAAWAFGPLGLGLAGCGLVATAREWRKWLPVWLHLVTTVAVMSTADRRYERFLVPTAGLIAILAGRGLTAILRRRSRFTVLAALLLSIPPWLSSLDYLRGIGRPSTDDQALDWILEHAPAGSRLLTNRPGIGFDPERYEVLVASEWEPTGRIQSAAVDFVIADVDWVPPAAQAERLWTAEGRRWEGLTVAIGRAPRRALRPVVVTARELSASENHQSLAAVLDNRLETLWQTSGPQRPGDWIEVRLERPVRVARVELVLGDRAGLFAENLHLEASTDLVTWKRVRVFQGRAALEQQIAFPESQVLLMEPVEAQGLRLVQMGRRRKPWGVAELRIGASD